MLPISEVKYFSNMCLSPIAAIMQKGHRHRLIFEFSWSRVNTKAGASAPEEAMRLSQSLHRLLDCIIAAESALRSIYLCKVDVEDSYMWIWIFPEDIPEVVFWVLMENTYKEKLIGFHKYLPIGYVDLAPCFFTYTKTVVDRTDTEIDRRDSAHLAHRNGSHSAEPLEENSGGENKGE